MRKELAAQRKALRNQTALLQEVAGIADEARKNAQAKFGVYRDKQKKLWGVYVNYKKPHDCKVMELRPQE